MPITGYCFHAARGERSMRSHLDCPGTVSLKEPLPDAPCDCECHTHEPYTDAEIAEYDVKMRAARRKLMDREMAFFKEGGHAGVIRRAIAYVENAYPNGDGHEFDADALLEILKWRGPDA